MSTENKIEKHNFNAEIHKVLKLVISSLYTNNDIFLRELISNSSDACSKIEYMARTDAKINTEKLKILITVNKKNQTLSIKDTGIGMNKKDLIENLGTIARSGTEKFLQELQKTTDKKIQSELIGQFGVGFYSAFMVAQNITVISKKFDNSEGWIWESSGEGSFTITKSTEELERGTSIILKLKEDHQKYLEKFTIKHIVELYSDHVNFPIEYMEEDAENEDDAKPAQINSAAALWKMPKNKITEEQHKEFFRSISHTPGDPLITIHNINEGTINYTNLLYIPSEPPFDLFNPNRKCSVKLYIKRVFITEENIKIVPQYMRFLKGVVDSDDLPLNISRENLQDNLIINKINTSLTNKIITLLKKTAEKEPEKYEKFWKNFGAVIKEGLCEPTHTEAREKLLNICRFYSNKQ